MNKNDKIESLQALRAIAFLGIFFSHSNFFVKWPGLGVSVFFVLSGFLMMRAYGNVDLNNSTKENLLFSINKIKKIYPLHILTMIFAVILEIALYIHSGISIHNIFLLIANIFLNVFLIQTWIPYSSINVSLNGVAWYLSVTMFLYFMFPYLKKYILKNNIRKLWIISCGLLALQVILCLPFIYFLGNESPVYIWFMYCFPVFRLVDFLFGMILYKSCHTRNASFAKNTFFEIAATGLTVFIMQFLKYEGTNIIIQAAIGNWTTKYIPLATIWVLLFYQCGGIVTKLLSNKIIIMIGNMSAFLFLIHYVITEYTNSTLSFLNIEADGWIKVILVMGELLLSILLSLVYKKYNGKILAHLKNQIYKN